MMLLEGRLWQSYKRSPKSERNFSPLQFIGQGLDCEWDKNVRLHDSRIFAVSLRRKAYLRQRRCSSCSQRKGMWRYLGVSATVKPHVRHLPPCQGIVITPSECFPSEQERPKGSLTDRMYSLVSWLARSGH